MVGCGGRYGIMVDTVQWRRHGKKGGRTYLDLEPVVSLLINLFADLLLSVLFIGEWLYHRLELEHK